MAADARQRAASHALDDALRQLRAEVADISTGSTHLGACRQSLNVPFVNYTGFSQIDCACANGPLVQKPVPAAELVAAVEALLPAA